MPQTALKNHTKGQRKQEVTERLAAANEVSKDVAVVAVLSVMDST